VTAEENIDQEHRVDRAQLRKKGQLTLPPRVRAALHVQDGDEVEFTISPAGDVVLRGMTTIPTDQKWFWARDWQAGEREASGLIAAGQTTVHGSTEDFLEHLDRLAGSG